MKTLVITTGAEAFVMDTWLPSLREKGQYSGDVLIVDYDANPNFIPSGNNIDDGIKKLESFSQESIDKLQQESVIYHRVKNGYNCIASDRIHAFNETLTQLNLWEKYDVLLFTDGNDILFLKPIQPLLNASKDELSVAAEPVGLIKNCGSFFDLILCHYPVEAQRFLADKPMLNAGVIAGSPSIIRALFAEILRCLDAYTSDFGSEQMALNLYCHRNGFRDIGAEFNCHPTVAGEKLVLIYQAFADKIVSYCPLKYSVKDVVFVKAMYYSKDLKLVDTAILHFHSRDLFRVGQDKVVFDSYNMDTSKPVIIKNELIVRRH